MTCQVCPAELTAVIRELWMQVGAVEIGVRARLCDACAESAPERIRKEIESPMIRSLLLVAGAKLGFKMRPGTPVAVASPVKSRARG